MGLSRLAPRRPRRPRRRSGPRAGLWFGSTLGAAALGAAGMVVLAATNTVAAPALDHRAQPISAQALAPAICDGLGLTTVVVNASGGSASELIVGNANANTLAGGGGNDCILAGGGADSVGGGNGAGDVCHGGAGIDSHQPLIGHGCETSIEIP